MTPISDVQGLEVRARGVMEAMGMDNGYGDHKEYRHDKDDHHKKEHKHQAYAMCTPEKRAKRLSAVLSDAGSWALSPSGGRALILAPDQTGGYFSRAQPAAPM